jgi:hypothetical protein
MYYLTILDYANGTVDQYDLEDHFNEEQLSSFQSEDFEEFITSEGCLMLITQYTTFNMEFLEQGNFNGLIFRNGMIFVSDIDKWITHEEYNA